MDVEEERPAGVRDVGGVDGAVVGRAPGAREAAGQAPEQERVDGAEGELAALGTGASAGHGVEDVRDLRAGEVGIEREAGALPEEGLVAREAQPLARRRGDPALPDDRVGDRLARRAVPDDRRLALVGDPDRGNPLRAADLANDVARHRELARPDRLRVVGHVARRRELLLERLLRAGDRPPVAPERDRARRGGALVEGEDQAVVAHGRPYSRRAVSR